MEKVITRELLKDVRKQLDTVFDGEVKVGAGGKDDGGRNVKYANGGYEKVYFVSIRRPTDMTGWECIGCKTAGQAKVIAMMPELLRTLLEKIEEAGLVLETELPRESVIR